MKIAVNTRLLRKDKMDGIGWFTYNTLKIITQNNPGVEFHFFFDSAIDSSFLFSENIIAHKLFPPAKHALLNIIWFEIGVKKLLDKINPDIFLSPDGILCLGWKGKQYGVIHDLNFFHMPDVLKYSNRKYYNYFFPKYARKATRIGTVSDFSKHDIVKTFGISEQKIDVLYNGINLFFNPVDEFTKQKTRAEFSKGNPYFVFTGTLSPRKNVIGLLKAFESFKNQTSNKLNLLIVGSTLYKTEELFTFHQKMKAKDNVFFTGRLSNEKIKNVVASAEAMIFVPFFEGFGIPLIEAMQCNVPVVASNATAIPEIVGHAALLVDPYNIEEIARAMTKISGDIGLREELITKGSVRKNFFSWDKTASLLWDGITKTL